MRKFSEISLEQLIFDVNIYEKINLECNDFSKYTNLDYGDYNEEINVYTTAYSKQIQRLIKFISDGDCVNGKCINCDRNTYFNITENNVSEEVKEDKLSSYTDYNCDDEDCYIPRPEDEFKKKMQKLIKSDLKGGYFDKYFICPKCKSRYKVSFFIELKNEDDSNKNIEMTIQKIGQYPNLIALKKDMKSQIKGVLKKIKALQDYEKSSYAYIDGYYVGAFTYMRRVFEKYLSYKYESVKEKLEINKEEFKKLNTKNKIDRLKRFLPDFITEQKVLYRVISAGIHSLEEEECKVYYSIIQNAIEIILYEEYTEEKRIKLKENTKNLLNDANSDISEKNKNKK